ncbi:MAG TPA: SsrA-binding protein SmpB [Clostridia bacterium]|jgi:SsrA-binding protein|nr:SsrA-binding protein SmpB [Clostridia bacterium]
MKQVRVVTENRKAHHDYFIEETHEAGIVLVGTEVKSLRAGKVNLKDSFAQIEKGEMFLYNVHISPYDPGNRFNVDPLRPRKLLLHKREINRLLGKVKQQGMTLIPLKIYFKKGRAKVELALAKGKKVYDKRRVMAERDAQREMARALREKERN